MSHLTHDLAISSMGSWTLMDTPSIFVLSLSCKSIICPILVYNLFASVQSERVNLGDFLISALPPISSSSAVWARVGKPTVPCVVHRRWVPSVWRALGRDLDTLPGQQKKRPSNLRTGLVGFWLPLSEISWNGCGFIPNHVSKRNQKTKVRKSEYSPSREWGSHFQALYDGDLPWGNQHTHTHHEQHYVQAPQNCLMSLETRHLPSCVTSPHVCSIFKVSCINAPREWSTCSMWHEEAQSMHRMQKLILEKNSLQTWYAIYIYKEIYIIIYIHCNAMNYTVISAHQYIHITSYVMWYIGIISEVSDLHQGTISKVALLNISGRHVPWSWFVTLMLFITLYWIRPTCQSTKRACLVLSDSVTNTILQVRLHLRGFIHASSGLWPMPIQKISFHQPLWTNKRLEKAGFTFWSKEFVVVGLLSNHLNGHWMEQRSGRLSTPKFSTIQPAQQKYLQ